MESVAAERLNKIGKNPSIVSNRDDFQDDIHTVNELIMQTTPLGSSSGSETSLNVDDLSRESKEHKKEKKAKKDKRDKDRLADTLSKLTLKKSKSDCYMIGKADRRSPDRKSSPPHICDDDDEEESLV